MDRYRGDTQINSQTESYMHTDKQIDRQKERKRETDRKTKKEKHTHTQRGGGIYGKTHL